MTHKEKEQRIIALKKQQADCLSAAIGAKETGRAVAYRATKRRADAIGKYIEALEKE